MKKRVWNLKEQVEIAKRNFDARPEWVKSISYFAGTNSVPIKQTPPKSKES